MQSRAISVSKDHKWIVCGTVEGASVWDAEMREKAIDVEGRKGMWAVHVSPDSTRFATGTPSAEASVWNIATGERLVGPLKQHHWVIGIRFCPSAERVATACRGNSIHVFDSHTGDELVTIKIDITYKVATPLAWSNDGQRIFATSYDNKIRTFGLLESGGHSQDGDDLLKVSVRSFPRRTEFSR